MLGWGALMCSSSIAVFALYALIASEEKLAAPEVSFKKKQR